MASDAEKSRICISCQECCKHLVFKFPVEEWDYRKSALYIARGCKIKVGAITVDILVPSVCQHLHPRSGCAIYDTRPDICREYDGRYDIHLRDICKWKELD